MAAKTMAVLAQHQGLGIPHHFPPRRSIAYRWSAIFRSVIRVTYCIGLRIDAGLVFLADTRTNAGVDNIALYRKLHGFEVEGERAIVILTAGNLSVTQTTLARLRHAIDAPEADPSTSILLAPTMLDVATIVGGVLSAVWRDVRERMAPSGQAPHANLIVGGERRGGGQRLFLVYPEGNFIEATEDTPYLQIGEHKYGKPILDRVVHTGMTLEEARKVVLISMDSTMRSNLSVGMPLDLAMIRRGSYRIEPRERIEPGDPAFTALSEAWSRTLRDGFAALP
jgi:putative proteasome-type protease